MYLKKSISWSPIGFQFFLLVLLQACSDPKGDPAPGPAEVVSTAKSCQTDRSFFDKFVADNYSAVKTSDGGKLYDKWWATLSKTAPNTDHPLWASRAKDSNGTAINTRSGGDSWRCKECHGWDYKGANGAYNTSNSHYTNFTGISAAVNDTNSDLFCKIRDGLGIDVLHKFNPDNTSGALTDLSVLALTKFVREGQVEVNDFIDATTAVATGNATAGEIVFTQATPASCANAGCHGAEGTNFNLSLGALSLENPWEVLHKIRFGQPGAFMPAFSETISEIEVKDVLAFTQTLSSTIPVQTCSIASAAFVSTGFAAANAAQGGRLYDNWIAELGVSAPAADHPLWVGRATNIDGSFANSRSGADSWRCKECHGWDYNGKDGAYNIASSHYTGFSGLLNAVSKTPIEVFCLIRDGEGIDPAHGFTPVLTANKLSDEHVLAMTKFILDANQMGMIDTTAIIPASGTVTGDALAGETVFKNIAGCGSVACHGPEGRKNGGGNSIGQLAFENPWEVLHKLRNGQAALGSPMPSFVTRLSDLQAQDVLAFAQTSLPRSTGAGNGATACLDEMNARGIDTLLTNVTPWDGGQLYDKWWAINETPPSIDHPLWALQNFNTRSGSATWRCKECHGWDYKGDAGAYSSGNSHFTGFTGILASASKTAADIFCAIRDGEGINVDHKFNTTNTSGLMTETRLLQLTKFITAGADAGMLDSAIFVDAAGLALGDAVLGNDVYLTKAKCSNCHGASGQTGVPVGVTLGDLANQNPWEVVHKIRFGNPGQFMPIYSQDGLATKLNNNEIKNVLAYAQTLPQTTVGGTPTTPATCMTDQLNFVTTNIDAQLASQGGALYDKWWVALGYSSVDGPTQDHPLWVNANSTNTSTGSATWRCKECHGWDYQGVDGAYGSGSTHFTGFPGVIAAQAKPAIELFCAISQGTAAFPEHKFNAQNSQLTDQAILQMTKFIMDSTRGVIDMNTYIEPVGKTIINANLSEGQLEFGRCSACHGADGTLNAGGSTLGTIAIANPYEILHKIRHGHPGSAPAMPAFVNSALSTTAMANIIAHVQTLPATGGQIPPPGNSSLDLMVRGGVLYDDWITANAVAAPALDNPLWIYQTSNNRTGAVTWRCKECHGWDYKGRDGQYGAGSSHFTGFIGVLGIASDVNVTEQDIFNIIKLGKPDIVGNTIHDFGALLSDPDITALATFIKQGVLDTSTFISPTTGLASGNVTNGVVQYTDTGLPSAVNNANCSFCHGLDGTTINFGTVTAPQSLGTLARLNPWEVLHKARFGQPASIMPSTELKGLSIGTMIDLLTYLQILPDATPPPAQPIVLGLD